MGQDPSKIRDEIEQTRAEMGDTVEAVVHRADVKERAKESLSERLDSAKGKVAGTASSVEGKAKRGAQRISSIGRDNPLGLALAGVGLGLLAGLVPPPSRIEQEKLGPVADELEAQARKTGHEALERGRHIAEEAAHSATQTAKEQGRQQAKELADDAKESGRKVSSRVGS